MVAEVQKQEYDSLSETKFVYSVGLARTLLRHSADNETEASAIFQEELDHCVDLLDRQAVLFQMGTLYRKVHNPSRLSVSFSPIQMARRFLMQM